MARNIGTRQAMFGKPAEHVSQYVPLPFEQIGQALDRRQKSYDDTAAAFDEIEDKILSVNALDPDEDRRNARLEEYQNAMTNKIEEAGGDYSQLSSFARSLGRKAKIDMTRGQLSGIASNYKAYKDWDKRQMKKIGKSAKAGGITNDDYIESKARFLAAYQNQKGVGNDPNDPMSIELEEVAAFQDINKDALKAAEAMEAQEIKNVGKWFKDQGIGDASLWRKYDVSTKTLGAKRLKNAIYEFMINDPKYDSYVNMKKKNGIFGIEKRLKDAGKTWDDVNATYNPDEMKSWDLNPYNRNDRDKYLITKAERAIKHGLFEQATYGASLLKEVADETTEEGMYNNQQILTKIRAQAKIAAEEPIGDFELNIPAIAYNSATGSSSGELQKNSLFYEKEKIDSVEYLRKESDTEIPSNYKGKAFFDHIRTLVKIKQIKNIDLSLIDREEDRYNHNERLLSLAKLKNETANKAVGLDSEALSKFTSKLPELKGFEGKSKQYIMELMNLYKAATYKGGDTPNLFGGRKKKEALDDPRLDEATKLMSTRGGSLNQKINYKSILEYENTLGDYNQLVKDKNKYLKENSESVSSVTSNWNIPGVTEKQIREAKDIAEKTFNSFGSWAAYTIVSDNKEYNGKTLSQIEGLIFDGSDKNVSVNGEAVTFTEMPLDDGFHAFAVPVIINDDPETFLISTSNLKNKAIDMLTQTGLNQANVMYVTGRREKIKGDWTPPEVAQYGVKINYKTDGRDEIEISGKTYTPSDGLRIIGAIKDMERYGTVHQIHYKDDGSVDFIENTGEKITEDKIKEYLK